MRLVSWAHEHLDVFPIPEWEAALALQKANLRQVVYEHVSESLCSCDLRKLYNAFLHMELSYRRYFDLTSIEENELEALMLDQSQFGRQYESPLGAILEAQYHKGFLEMLTDEFVPHYQRIARSQIMKGIWSGQ